MTSATLNLGGHLRTAMAFAALATCTAIGAIGSAHAATADSPALTVRYADLDLSTEQGSLALYGRIVAAANQVCGVDSIQDMRGNLRALAAARACRNQAIAQAVRDVNSPKLASVYAERTRRG